MYLSKLEIFGFKSFADKTKIEFDAGVSAIVGPNGSGKSNIVDAIRWALGEQGDRILRSEKRDDVVFNGSKTRKPLSIAEVSLTFQNNQNILPTEYTDVQIARRFFRNGETEYFLNGTKVRLKDIKNLFRDTGIGPDAYSVIELKMVELILSAVKNERRKLFEEAAGVVSYKQNRDQTIKKLESVRDTLSRVNDIIKEKQKNVNTLERQAKRTEEAKIISDELKNLEAYTCNVEYSNLIDGIDKIKFKESENIQLKLRLTSEIEENDMKIDEMRINYSGFEKIVEELNGKINKLKEDINESEKNELISEQKISNANREKERLETEITELRNSIQNNAEKLEDTEKKIKILNSTLELSDISLAEKKSDLDSQKELIKEKKKNIFELGLKLKESGKSLTESRSTYQENKINLENNLNRLKQLSALNENNLLQIDGYIKEKNKLVEEHQVIKDEIEHKEREYKYKADKKEETDELIKSSEKNYSEKKIELEKKKSFISYLKNLLETYEDYAEGIKYLLKDREEENIKTVIDAIETDDRYKIAIETALGEVSNYLVVKDSKILNKLINILSIADKGKVTFILNDKLEFDYHKFGVIPDYRPEFLNNKKVLGFAPELIQLKDRDVEILLKYLLDEYVVVEDLDTAFKLAKDNFYKFITLEGDIVTQSFVRAGSQIMEDNIKLGREKQINRISNEIHELELQLSGIEEELTDLRRRSKAMDTVSLDNELTSLEKELQTKNTEISKLEFKIDEINKSISSNEKLYNEIQNANIKLNENINTLIAELEKNENEHSNIEKEMSFLTTEFEVISQKYTDTLSEYNNYNIELTKLRNETKNEEQNLLRITRLIENQKEQIQRNIENIRMTEEEKEALEKEKQENSAMLAGLKSSLMKLSEEFTVKKKNYDNIRKILEKIDMEQRERRKKFDAVSQKLVDSQIRIRENEIKSTQLKEYILKKYGIDIPILLTEENKIFYEKIKEEYFDSDLEFDITRARKTLDELTEKLKKLGGGFQEIIWNDFQNEKEELEKLVGQRNDLNNSEKYIRNTIDKLNREARERFLKTFEEIRQNFIKMFKELFQEGDEANLRLVYDIDEENKIIDDPLEAKIEITAKPRGKRPTSIELLSQGEKTLTAIALLFAIYMVKPSPFCILDEVDAPLDPANLLRFNKMIRKFSTNTQFILITHNERTMEKVDKLYGVTMQEDGVTTIVETKFKNA